MNRKPNHPRGGIGILAAIVLGITPAMAAPPDLTAGDTIPGNLQTTWNLGPTGMRGWVYYDTSGGGINGSVDSRQIQVRSVAPGSPAAGVFQPDDLILGASGTAAAPALFDIDARKGLAAAIADAEARDPAHLRLIRWRAGSQSVVIITLRTMGAYSTTAPYDCPKSEKILKEGMDHYYHHESSGRYRMGVLSLLAAQHDFFPAPDRALYLQRAENEARALIKNASTLNALRNYTANTTYPAPWGRAHELILLGEYYLITGDELVLPTIEALAINIAKGASHYGTMAHSLRQGSYDASGTFRPVNTGYGVVNNIGMPCLLGVQLAKLCGVDDPVVDDMIDRAKMFYASYADKGSIPYGEHEPFVPRHENNGKNALAAIHLDNDPAYEDQAGFFVRMALASGDTDRDVGHTGAYFNFLWTPMGVQRGGPAAVQAYFNEISWLLDLHRRWDGGFDYDSFSENRAPNGTEYYNFRMSTAMLLTYALPLETLHITGRDSTGALVLSAAQISECMEFEDYDASARGIAQLVADLGVWSPKVRRLAAAELGNRTINTATRNEIRALAMDVDGNSRYGAVQALGEMRDTGFTGQLVDLLDDDDGQVRTLAANALHQFHGSHKVPYRAAMMTTLVDRARPAFPADPEDPLQFDQAALITAIFGGGAFANNRSEMDTLVSQVGSELFFDALKVASRHPTGRARGRIRNLYRVLTPAEVDLMAPELVDMVALGSDADRMFSLDVRDEAMQAMARNLVADAVPAAIKAIEESNGWGQFHNNLLDGLIAYGGSSTLVTPDPDVTGFAQSYLSGGTSERAQALLDAIHADTSPTPPVPFKSIVSATADHPNVDTSTNTTNLRVSAIDHAGGDSIFTWTMLSGPGTATITPNGTNDTESALVFDGTPGAYQFQVTMSDSRGFTEAYETVPVTLIDSDGGDVTPPYLDPAIWETPPTAIDGFSITMTALTATDPSGVEYYFACTSGGGNDSGWQDSPTYTDTGLTPATTYGYQVKVRDKSPNQNETELFTPPAFATTHAVAIDPLADPGGPYDVPSDGSLSLDGSASLPSEDETITSWEWDLRNDGTFDVTGETPSAISYDDLQTIFGMVVGPNTIQLRVTDSAAKSSTVQGTITLFISPFQDGAWTANDSGDWDDETNWLDEIIANGADKTATFEMTGGGNRTITLDTGRTIGNIVRDWPANGQLIFSGGPITLAGTTPTISNSDLSGARRMVISAPVNGTDGLRAEGGIILLNENSTNYTGDTTVDAQFLSFGNIPLADIGGGTDRNITITEGSGVQRQWQNMNNDFLQRIVETTDEVGIFLSATGGGDNNNDLDFSSSTGADLPNAFLSTWAGNGAQSRFNGVITPAADAYRIGYPGQSGVLHIMQPLIDITDEEEVTTPRGLIIGGGAVNLVNENTFTGNTELRAGRLFLGRNLALQNSALDVGDNSFGGEICFNDGPGANAPTPQDVVEEPVIGGLIGSRNLASIYNSANQNNTSRLAASEILGITLRPGDGKTHTYEGNVALNSGMFLTKTGEGTQILTGENTHTGATTVEEGTLALVGADMASPIIVEDGASLGFTPGDPATSSQSVDLTEGTVTITGTVDNATDYLLMTADLGFTGTPVLDAPVAGYVLELQEGDTELWLVLDGDAPASPYATWAATNAPTGNPGDDFDGDGVPNAIEFVLGGSAATNDLDKLPVATAENGDMTFTFIRDQASVDPSVEVVIEVGTDLATWPDVFAIGADTGSSTAGVTVTDNEDGTDTIMLTVAQAPDTKKFARLKVTIDE